jgi:hypothetical protein
VYCFEMDKDDEYRKQAAEAQNWADRTISAVDKASWLRIAQGWLALISRPKQTDREAFDADTKARRTGQETSDKSN